MHDKKGETALMKAAQLGHVDIVKLLIEKEKNMLDKDGRNARWHAIGKCGEILAKTERCACKDLFDAVRYGCVEHCTIYIN